MHPKAINDLRPGTQAISQELLDAAGRVVASGWFVMGPEVNAFEQEFAGYCGVPHCVGVANGTDALEVALRALGIVEGSRVATVANAGMYSSCAIRAIGAQPVYVDVDEGSMVMGPQALQAAPLDHCDALIVTHLYGQLADMDSLCRIAHAKGIPVIEDCAQAHGARHGTSRAGSFGDVACFSFYPTKNLGALGDGGAIVTRDSAVAEAARKLRQYGWSRKYFADAPGGRNSRLDEMQAAFLRVKLKHLDSWNARRRQIAARYAQKIRNPHVRLPMSVDESYVAHLYVVRTPKRDALAAHLKSASVPVDIHYPVPDYRQPALGLGHAPPLPVTEALCAAVLTVPCYPEMSYAQVDAIADAVNAWMPVHA